MYLLRFVNAVRAAQGLEEIGQLPRVSDIVTPLELALGCRVEAGLLRLPSAEQASAVAAATGLPAGIDGRSVALPGALGGPLAATG